MSLTVIVPVFNEEKTVKQVIKRILLQKEVDRIIIVDDGSQDNTRNILKLLKDPKIKVIFHEKNLGKGAAFRTGLKYVTGDYVIVQDADLEYDPRYFKMLLRFANSNTAVYGSRIKGGSDHAYTRTYLGNVLITWVFNILFNRKLTDSYTCYKLIPTKVAKSLDLSSNGFEIEAEITAKLAKKGVEIVEVPIRYNPRKYEQGKKIKAVDALKGVLTYLTVRFTSLPSKNCEDHCK